MASIHINDIPSKVEHYVSRHRLRDAFKLLRHYSSHLGDWRITDEIDRMEESYSMMLRYATQGAVDPERDEMYSSIVRKIYAMLDRISRQISKPKSSNMYFSTVRYEEMQAGDTVGSLMKNYKTASNEASPYNMINASSAQASERMMAKEDLEKRIFNKVWTLYPVSSDDDAALREAFESPVLPDYFKDMLISAVLLGLTHYYDERRVMMLLDIYEKSQSVNLSMRALCAALLGMYMNRSRLWDRKLRQRIDSLRELTSWSSDVKLVFMQFIRSRDTERINRKMQEEVFPEMLKLRPDIARKISGGDGLGDIANLEENPEWQELLDKSGIADKIKDLSKMQEDGGDVFMSTFANLKSFPFFSDVVNWFMPFHLDNLTVKNALGSELSAIGNLVLSSPFLCNGDKYSFILALSSVPAMQRRMMLSQFDAQNLNELELRNASLGLPSGERDNVANKYVQDLYRFFKLYRRKGDFNDPFIRPINLLQLAVLAPDLTDVDTLSVVGEFYFKRGYYDDAYHVFEILGEILPPDSQLYQKMGYCCQKSKNTAKALKYYEQAELLNADSLWTMRRLAACYKLMGNPAKALEYFKRIEAKKSDDPGVALNIGHCLLELDRPDEALNYYFKADFIDEKSTRAWRPLAWCSFIAGDMVQSEEYYNKVLTDNPSSGDYMNMGHLNLAKGDIREAINFYNLAIDANNGDVESFINNYNADRNHLLKAGVEGSLLPLVVDAILYSRD